jgi:hypothetical protein
MDPPHLLAALRYVLLNPVRAGLAKDCDGMALLERAFTSTGRALAEVRDDTRAELQAATE